MRKLVEWWKLKSRRRPKSMRAFGDLTGRELVAAFGGDLRPLPLDDPDLKPERVQGW